MSLKVASVFIVKWLLTIKNEHYLHGRLLVDGPWSARKDIMCLWTELD